MAKVAVQGSLSSNSLPFGPPASQIQAKPAMKKKTPSQLRNFGGNCNEEVGMEEEGAEGSPSKLTPKMFCKTLIASDTSTHGGFLVSLRDAEHCFPPLDCSQQRPSQELMAKDLHGVQWRFRHIYRGQPSTYYGMVYFILLAKASKCRGCGAFLRGEDGEVGIEAADDDEKVSILVRDYAASKLSSLSRQEDDIGDQKR